MIISLIAAMSEERVIGHDGKLPWNIPTDLARFKSITMGHALLMGRKTFESIGRPLPGRKNIVLSRSLAEIEGCLVARSLTEAISAGGGDDEIFVCGGEKLFQEALPFCQRIYLTVVHGSYQGDVHFPQIPDSFLELQREELTATTPPLSFLVFERVEPIEPGADAQKLREKGKEAMQRELYFLARRCFQQALLLDDHPATASELAFCMAQSGADSQKALLVAEQALAREPDNLRCLLNLGRVRLLAGAKEKGLTTLRSGVQRGGGKEFLAELERCGNRKPAPIRSLPRNHFLNKYLGIMLHHMGLR
jgi:dihydrofolate reductase